MPSISTIGNRAYPSILEITEDSVTHTIALQTIKAAAATYERRDRDFLNSFIRFGELVDLGIINANGDLILQTGGDGSLTVEDEGNPLTTLADTLNFVGAGVTATGSGGVKTITIPGGGGGGVTSFEGRVGAVVAIDGDYEDFYLQKALVAAQTVVGDVEFSGAVEMTNIFGFRLGPSCELDMDSPSGATVWFQQYGTFFCEWGLAGADFQSIFFNFTDSFTHYRFGSPILIEERAAAINGPSTHGQLWVRDDNPNILMFTDGDDNDWIVDVTAA